MAPSCGRAVKFETFAGGAVSGKESVFHSILVTPVLRPVASLASSSKKYVVPGERFSMFVLWLYFRDVPESVPISYSDERPHASLEMAGFVVSQVMVVE